MEDQYPATSLYLSMPLSCTSTSKSVVSRLDHRLKYLCSSFSQRVLHLRLQLYDELSFRSVFTVVWKKLGPN
uniref:Uncharacterized protein n=1 Tax=Ditylenchus dipsaci TaxID=166011 RepID=A0A915EUN5_9BILA